MNPRTTDEPRQGEAGRDFGLFWAGAAISNLGDGMRLAAFPLLALDLTDDARLIGGLAALSFAPWIVVGPFAGVLVDRHDRRRLIMLSQIARGTALLALALSVDADGSALWMLAVVSSIVGTGETVVDSASQAAIPQLVPDRRLERANGQMTVAENLFNQVIGIALGAVAYSWSPSLPFYLNAASFGLSAGLLAALRRPLRADRPNQPNTTVRRDLVDGFAFLLRERFLRTLAGSVAVTNLAIHVGLGVMVILVVDELGAAPEAYGTVLAIGATGGVIGSVVSGRLVAWLSAERALRLTHLPFIAAACLYVVATDVWVVSGAFALSSFAVVLFQIPSRAMRQRHTPRHLLGRVVAAFRVFGFGGPVIGAPLGGAVTEFAGVRAAFGTSLFGLVLAALIAQRAASHGASVASGGAGHDELTRTPTGDA